MAAIGTSRARWARVLAMSGDELRTRTRQELGKRWDALRFRLGFSFEEPTRRDTMGLAPARFFFDPSDVPRIAALLRDKLPEQAAAVLGSAEKICRHRFDLLGYEDLDYGAEIDWHRDAVNNKRAPRRPSYQVPFLDFEHVGDTKVTWELNRHQHLVTLARAWCLTGDPRFAAEILRQWHHWQRENPYPLGINWASSLEVAFRSLSWLWVRALLAGCSVVPADFPPLLLRSLGRHGRHIERYLSIYYSPNTHLLGEAVALFFLGTLCPELAAAPRWQRCGWNMVLEEAARQVRPDGFHFEQSTYYHVYALDFFLHARILAARNGMAVPREFDATVVRMLDILCALGRTGAPPRLGDDDGGRVFDPRRNRQEHLLDPLVTGAALFGRAEFKAVAGVLREETLWLLGPEGAARFDQLRSTAPKPVSSAFAPSGLYVLASGEPLSRQLVVDAGPLGAVTGGHGHADALSVHLSAGGREWLVDPGTFLYVEPRGERDCFRGTAAHNTLRVDGCDQAEPAGPFSWRALPEVSAERWVAGETFDLFAASHRGYERLASPVVHCRWVFHLRSQFWLVRDEVRGRGEHQLDLFWHLGAAPDPEWKAAGGLVLQAGEERMELLAAADHGWSVGLREGWLSPAYGVRQPGWVLQFGKRAEVPAEFATLLRAGRSADTEPGVLERVRGQAAGAEVSAYRFTTGGGSHWIFFAPGGRRWQCGEWAADAEFLYGSLSPEGEIRHLAMCNGSFAERGGKPCLATEHVVQRCEWRELPGEPRVSCSDPDAVRLVPARSAVEETAMPSGAPGSPSRGAS